MPYSQDALTRVFNVSWGGDAIVVFMETSPWNPQPVYGLSPLGEAATFLDIWQTPTYGKDPAPLKNSAYRVKANATDEFLRSTAPSPPEDINGTWLSVLVFAGGMGLADVIQATKLMAPALYILNAANADLPSEVAPPGLLWGITTGTMVPGVTMDWKLTFNEHRDDGNSPSPLPNAMMQCYPVITSHSGYGGGLGERVTYTGYFLIAYRLDRAGTGDVYSQSPKSTEAGAQNLPPEWNVVIVTGVGATPLRGIPFGDPPPLISADVN